MKCIHLTDELSGTKELIFAWKSSVWSFFSALMLNRWEVASSKQGFLNVHFYHLGIESRPTVLGILIAGAERRDSPRLCQNRRGEGRREWLRPGRWWTSLLNNGRLSFQDARPLRHCCWRRLYESLWECPQWRWRRLKIQSELAWIVCLCTM